MAIKQVTTSGTLPTQTEVRDDGTKVINSFAWRRTDAVDDGQTVIPNIGSPITPPRRAADLPEHRHPDPLHGNNMPGTGDQVIYHGTNFPIHTSKDPYLDPSKSKGGDEGDPEQPHVFGTPSKLWASIFSLKTDNCIAISMGKKPVLVFYGDPPRDIHGGWVYELPSKGFKEVLARGKPTGKWAMVDEDMPIVTSSSGQQVKGIPLADVPVTQISGIEQLMEEYGLQVYVLPESADLKTFIDASRDAGFDGKYEYFLQEQVTKGNLKHLHITSKREAAERLLADLMPHFYRSTASTSQKTAFVSGDTNPISNTMSLTQRLLHPWSEPALARNPDLWRSRRDPPAR